MIIGYFDRGLLRVGATLGFAIAAMLATGSPACAQGDGIEQFYKGRQLRLVIGYSVGGGYDIYGRIAAEFLGRYIPGNPAIVPQNMPGAGSMAAARYLFAAAPRDGTVIATLAQTLPLDMLVQGEKSGFDITQMPYIGRLTTNVDFGQGRSDAKFKSFDDARQRELVVAATAGASPANIFPTALNRFAGSKFKILVGYPGSNDMLLALERGEVDLIGANGLASTLVRNPDWILKKQVPILYQASLKRHPLLPDVPTLEELGTSPEGRAVLRAISSSSEFGRSLMTTPGVPADRVAALRKAVQAMVADPQFLAVMKERRIMIEPATGEELDRLTAETARLPRPVVEMIAQMLK